VLGDGFEVVGNGPHVDVFAVGYDLKTMSAATDQDPRCQQDQPGFDL
jgi:hypothetical protein